MNRQFGNKSDSTIEQRLESVKMTDSERRTAVAALHNAEVLVDVFAWFARKIEQVGERSFLKPVLKH
jgi:hypothetical protein